MSFFNINFKNKNEICAIGIIGGVDGPTAIHSSKDIQRKRKEREDFLTYAAKKITPCERTFKQLEEYLVEKYKAVPHILSPNELKVLKANVILNHFNYVLDKPETIGENLAEEGLKDTYLLQAREYPSEKLGLELKAYKLLNTVSKLKLKQKDKQESINPSFIENDVIIEIETKSQYLSIINGDDEIMYDLLLYLGVSEKDIREKTPRFITYAYALKHIGKL